jgi:integrase
MSRETSPYIVGDYWLDKRRAGRSVDTWQIAHYDAQARTIVYRSTKRRTIDLEAAKETLRTYEAAQRSKSLGQNATESRLVPHLINYARERGPEVKRLDTIVSSFRAWCGFLEQDELTTGAFVADITRNTIARFRRWRMEPHSWAVEWGGKVYRHTSTGVTGETVQRNIEDLRAALNHAKHEGRVDAPRVHSVERKYRSEPRNIVLTIAQLGAIFGYASDDLPAYRWLCLILATASRPGPAMAFNPAAQWHSNTLDLHPGGLRSDKRNAVVPVIPDLVPILTDWRDNPHAVVKSRKTWWRTMRRVLNLDPAIAPYTVRHTVATWLDAQGVPGADISGITGHLPSHRGIARTTSKHYLHYDPANCPKAVDALCSLFQATQAEAVQWRAVHLLCTPSRGNPKQLATNHA